MRMKECAYARKYAYVYMYMCFCVRAQLLVFVARTGCYVPEAIVAARKPVESVGGNNNRRRRVNVGGAVDGGRRQSACQVRRPLGSVRLKESRCSSSSIQQKQQQQQEEEEAKTEAPTKQEQQKQRSSRSSSTPVNWGRGGLTVGRDSVTLRSGEAMGRRRRRKPQPQQDYIRHSVRNNVTGMFMSKAERDDAEKCNEGNDDTVEDHLIHDGGVDEESDVEEGSDASPRLHPGCHQASLEHSSSSSSSSSTFGAPAEVAIELCVAFRRGVNSQPPHPPAWFTSDVVALLYPNLLRRHLAVTALNEVLSLLCMYALTPSLTHARTAETLYHPLAR
eukprot:GHVU01144166.1.p1 GENE.GHVU01144166.1~~GHVU01144166.1.p1  ORF type:complete len:334 (+),score=55.36 GHVU01144166.1:422-1423(+)